MSSTRDWLLGNGDSGGSVVEPGRKAAVGASQKKLFLRYYPLPGNPSFGGQFLARPYHCADAVAGSLDFSKLAVHYSDGGRFVLGGHHLKGIADKIEAGTLGHVIQQDALEAAGERHVVAVSVRGDELEALRRAVAGLRTARIDGVEAAGADPGEARVTTMEYHPPPPR